jgi:hypothetical protein
MADTETLPIASPKSYPSSSRDPERAADLKVIVERVARAHRISIEALRGKSRMPEHVRARRDVAVAARNAGYSFAEIGRAILRDHSTVLLLVKRADLEVTAAIESMRSRVAVSGSRGGARITVDLTAEEASELFRIADMRRESAPQMLADVVRHIITDDLFAALLDR